MLSDMDRHEWKDDCLLCDLSAEKNEERSEKVPGTLSPDPCWESPSLPDPLTPPQD